MAWVLTYLGAFVLSLGFACVLTPLAKKLSFVLRILDEPTIERKIHREPMPLLGGLGVLLSFLAVILGGYAVMVVAADQFPHLKIHLEGARKTLWPLSSILLGAVLIVLLGMLDDKIELKAFPKLLGQVGVAVLIFLGGSRITLFQESTVVSFILTVFWIVAIINAMNFLDNMDGLCSGVGLIATLSFAFVAGVRQQYFVCVMAMAFAGALLGFLFFNFKPASIFLGDAGSHLVGLMVSVLAIKANFYEQTTPTILAVFIPVIVLAVPIYDMITVMMIRIRKGQPVYIGDRNHISHRLVKLGIPQKVAVVIIYFICLALGLGAVTLIWAAPQEAYLIFMQSIVIFGLVLLLQIYGQRDA